MNSHIPSLSSHLQLRDVGDIKMLAGLETDSDAIIKVSHSYLGADVEDFKVHLSLHNGNTIITESKWRHEAIKDVARFIKTSAGALESLASDQHWVDLETAMSVLHESSEKVIKDLITLSNMELKIYFNELKRVTRYFRRLGNDQPNPIFHLIEYYANSIDTFADFGLVLV